FIYLIDISRASILTLSLHDALPISLMFVQRAHAQVADAGPPLLILRADAHHLGIGCGKLVQFYKNQAASFGKRRMAGTGWIAQIAAGRVIAAFIAEHTFQYKNFFAQRVVMLGKTGTGQIAHKTGGLPLLWRLTLQWDALNRRLRSRQPGLFA